MKLSRKELKRAQRYKVTFFDEQGRVITGGEARQLLGLDEELQLSDTSVASVEHTENAPPLAAKFTLHFLLSKKQRTPIIGDLDEEYKEALALFGKKAADVLYWKQALQSLLPLLWQWAVRLVRLYDVLRTIK